jgi:hypothetical protein
MYKMTIDEQSVWDNSVKMDPEWCSQFIALRKSNDFPGGYVGILKFENLWKGFVAENHDLHYELNCRSYKCTK